MKATENYGLKKPESTDFYNVNDFNGNMDVVDAELKSLSDGVKKSQSDNDTHAKNTENPHGVTKEQVGLGNVPNVSTNDQTPTYADSATLSNLSSGEKLSIAFGKIKVAMGHLITHLQNKSNPHVVTKSQVGLGNVPNVTTNDQTPTYSVASSVAELTNGEKLSVAFGKIAKSISTLVSHIADRNNPHQVSKSQVGLSNVPNVTTNNQTPTYTEATELTELASGEKLSTAFGKLKLVVKNVISILKLLGTTDISTIGDGTVTGILKLILDKLTWKNYKNATGAVTIELPEDYNELLIKINIKSADIIVNVPVLYVELYDTVQSFRGGWRQQEANGGMVSFAASKTSISFAAAFLNEENVTTTTSWSVYYR